MGFDIKTKSFKIYRVIALSKNWTKIKIQSFLELKSDLKSKDQWLSFFPQRNKNF